eukprot:scaffold53796_cov72-Phaeocystis_antarctica.AAC.1
MEIGACGRSRRRYSPSLLQLCNTRLAIRTAASGVEARFCRQVRVRHGTPIQLGCGTPCNA